MSSVSETLDELEWSNAGQLGLGSSRPKSSWPGSTRPGNIYNIDV